MSKDERSEEPPPKLFSAREEWKDVKPIEQTELSNPLVPIFYPPEYKDALDYFRGIVATEERSERVLELTERIIRMNPAHYSVWQYRYETLMALNSSLEKEIRLMDELALAHMKFYQVWHHRKLLMMKHKRPLAELSFIAKVLAMDQKIALAPNNLSAWNYLRGVLNKTGTKFGSVKSFVIPYTLPREEGASAEEVLDLDNPSPSSYAALPCALAIEFLVDVCEEEGELNRAVELLTSLAEEHDTMRKRYWDYRAKNIIGNAAAAPTSANS
ncbi:CAAX geranylgeranyltransferase alpha subunit [Serendipita sp. 398]|nr:CAAX geranylgeranyltransferase alpha subunit [Serendipita sp. 398]